jgi:hypothetical protein
MKLTCLCKYLVINNVTKLTSFNVTLITNLLLICYNLVTMNIGYLETLPFMSGIIQLDTSY